MAYTTIDDPTDYFNSVLWTGNGSNRDITGVGFQPDFTWIKQRNGTFSHVLGNSLSGDNKFLVSSAEQAESTDTDKFRTFVSDGFQVGTHNGVNGSSNTYVGWNWKETATAGFDIVSYTGNGSARTISHSLSAVPKMFMTKRTDSSESWGVYHHTQGAGKFLRLNNTDAADTSSTLWNNTTPTSSVFSVAVGGMSNTNGGTYIAYLFAEKKGFSKFGSYIGNGSTDGTFVYTGFKPAWVMSKRTDSSGNSWRIFDNKRPGFNTSSFNFVHANLNDAEATGDAMDLNSNGFKIRTNSTDQNTSNGTYIYIAIAESPFVTSTGIPTTAR